MYEYGSFKKEAVAKKELGVQDLLTENVAGFSLSNYIKILVQQEACDWTGKREADLRVAERDRVSLRRGGESISTENRRLHGRADAQPA